MSSTPLVISLAFLTGFVFSYGFLRKLIKDILSDELKEKKFFDEEVQQFRKDTLKYYKISSERYKRLDTEIDSIMNEAVSKANNIVKHNKQQLDQILSNNICFNSSKVTEQVEKAILALKANTANIAAEAVKKIILEQRGDHKCNYEVMSSLLRTLNTKVHLDSYNEKVEGNLIDDRAKM